MDGIVSTVLRVFCSVAVKFTGVLRVVAASQMVDLKDWTAMENFGQEWRIF